MPELPEVETVRRELYPSLIHQKLETPIIYWQKVVHSPYEEYLSSLAGKEVIDVTRVGKYLILNLNDDHRILFHLRMEGKLFVVDKNHHSLSHLSLFLPFQDSSLGLAFYDTRKFGVTYYLKNDEPGPLAALGPEPFDIKKSSYLYSHYHKSSKMIKELLLDQTIMAGLGNIYANETLFACKISPFLPGNKITKKNCEDILNESIRILNKAIELNGSTVRSYHATQEMDGQFQQFLKVYSHQGEECPVCHHKIEKRFVSSRGTEYCPYCQHTGLTVAITGKIASGKSLATSYFVKEGFVSFSADEAVHQFYADEKFLTNLKKLFPMVFTPMLDKKKITELLTCDKAFKRKYLAYLFSCVREKANDFIITNNGKDKILELPVLFDAGLQHEFSILVGVETTKQKAHLKERGEDPSRADFNQLNSYDKHRHELTYILHSDGTKRELRKQVKDLVQKIREAD